MNTRDRSHRRQRREQELAFFMPQEAPQTDHYTWIDDLTNEEFADLLGPSWAELTGRCADYLIPDISPRRRLA